jgi:hypothetical protein
MDNPKTRPNILLLATTLIVVGLSIYGLYTSLHLVDIHYREPGRTEQFFKDFPILKFLESSVPAKYKIPLPEPEPANTVKDTAEQELEQHYNVFGNFENPDSPAPGSEPVVEEEPYQDPFEDIQAQDPKKWIEEQQAAIGDETCDIDEKHSCTTVDQSEYSSVGGIAVSVIGVAGYCAMIVLGLIILAQRPARPNVFVALVWIGAIIGFAYSMHLTYIEAY